jgi:hypothetical protein
VVKFGRVEKGLILCDTGDLLVDHVGILDTTKRRAHVSMWIYFSREKISLLDTEGQAL